MIGNKQVTTYINQVIDNDTLHHAYIFIGPDHVGKKLFAKETAARLLDVPLSKVSIHPDLLFIEQEVNKKTKKTKKYIDVEQIANVRRFFSTFSSMGGYKIVIIDGAEKMNMQASNALLKTLEELKDKCLLIFLSNNEEALLATIKSRCHSLYFQPLSSAEMNKVSEEPLNNTQKEMLQAARGLPGLYMKWYNNPEEWELYQKEVSRFIQLFGIPYHEKLVLVEDVFGKKKDHIETRKHLYQTLELWEILSRDIYLQTHNILEHNIHNTQINTTVSKDSMVLLRKNIQQALFYIRKNVHPRLLIEEILLSIP